MNQTIEVSLDDQGRMVIPSPLQTDPGLSPGMRKAYRHIGIYMYIPSTESIVGRVTSVIEITRKKSTSYGHKHR
jgi:hypothetical protein